MTNETLQILRDEIKAAEGFKTFLAQGGAEAAHQRRLARSRAMWAGWNVQWVGDTAA